MTILYAISWIKIINNQISFAEKQLSVEATKSRIVAETLERDMPRAKRLNLYEEPRSKEYGSLC